MANIENEEPVDISVALSPNDIKAVPGIIRDIATSGNSLSEGNNVARLALLEKSRELVRALETPRETMIKHIWSQTTCTIAIVVGVKIGLFKELAKDEGSRKKTDDLANALSVEPMLLARFLRHIAAMGYLSEVAADEYVPTNFSKSLAIPIIADGYPCLNSGFLASIQALPSWLADHDWKTPKSISDGPYQAGYNTKLNIFEWLHSHPPLGEQFHHHMSGYRQGRPSWMDVDFYPVQERLVDGIDMSGDSVLLVDIGGSIGHDMVEFHRKHPDAHGRLVLQELPQVIGQIVDLDEKIERMAYDFFNEQPITGARAYYLHSVLHDWSDDICLSILARITAAMKPGYSKLLINENVIPATGADWQATSLDILMMCFTSSKERTEGQWRSLLTASGLKVTKIWSTDKLNGVESLIELQPYGATDGINTAEILGVITAIGSITAAGIKLAKAFSTFADELGTAGSQIKIIATDTKAIARILHVLKKRLRTKDCVTEDILENANAIVTVCQAVIKDIEVALLPLIPQIGTEVKMVQKARWLFAKAKISTKQASLDSLKLTLTLFLHTIDFDGREEGEDLISDEINNLVENTKSTKSSFLNAELVDQIVEKAYKPTPGTSNPEESTEEDDTGTNSSRELGFHQRDLSISSSQRDIEISAESVSKALRSVSLQDTPLESARSSSDFDIILTLTDDQFLEIAEQIRLQRKVASFALVVLHQHHHNREVDQRAEVPKSTVGPNYETDPMSTSAGTVPERPSQDSEAEHPSNNPIRDTPQDPLHDQHRHPPHDREQYSRDTWKNQREDSREGIQSMRDSSSFSENGAYNSFHSPREVPPYQPQMPPYPASDHPNRGYNQVPYGYYPPPQQYQFRSSPPWSPPSQPPFEKDTLLDPEKKAMRKRLQELEAMQAKQEHDPEKEAMKKKIQQIEKEAAKKENEARQKEMERRIREEAEINFQRKMEEIKRDEELRAEERKLALDKAKKETDEARRDAERAVREAIEAERRAEAERKKAEAEAVTRVERDARAKIEAEIRAEKEAKDAAEKKKKGFRRLISNSG